MIGTSAVCRDGHACSRANGGTDDRALAITQFVSDGGTNCTTKSATDYSLSLIARPNQTGYGGQDQSKYHRVKFHLQVRLLNTIKPSLRNHVPVDVTNITQAQHEP
jgi:hypothetical protein